MNEHFCEFDHNLDEPCGKPASIKWRGMWFCAEHYLELLTTNEVAGLLKVRPKTVREWCSKRMLNGVLLGNRLRFRKTAVDLFISKRETR